MDFDERFDLEFKEHIWSLYPGVDILDLLGPTSADTREGDLYSFKPTRLWIGTSTSLGFFSGICCNIESKVTNPNEIIGEEALSSLWIRFNETGDRLYFRLFCRGERIHSLRPYEGNMSFRDIAPGQIELRAQREVNRRHQEQDGLGRIVAQLTIRSKRPPHTLVRITPSLCGKDTIYNRRTTEADFFDDSKSKVMESDAGAVCPLGSTESSYSVLVKPGHWLVHRFEFLLTIRQYKLLWMCMVRLRMINLHPSIYITRNPPKPPQIKCLDTPPFGTHPFPIRYLVEVLISHGVISAGQTDVSALSLALNRYPLTQWTLLLEGLHNSPRIVEDFERDLREVAECLGPLPLLPTYCTLVLRCLVTPLRCLLQPPQREVSNSMLRAFPEYLDRFMRVQFIDDDGDELPITYRTSQTDAHVDHEQGIFARIRRTIKYGIHVAGRHYVFLCFGVSQVKERGCWMISEHGDFTIRKVLDWIGDLTEERNVAKYAMRQGLVLSTTRAVDITFAINDDLPDIKSSCGNYTFTDGVGHCSQADANRCAATLGYDFTQSPPSAVQVSIGGSKGILVVVPDDQIKEGTIALRESMMKFKSDNKILNVLAIATYKAAYLNRQVILLLEALGVSSDVLLEIFKGEKSRIDSLGNEWLDDLERSPSINRFEALTTFPLSKAIQAGFRDDPLLQNVLRVIRCRLLSDLKWKARVEIKDGAYLMGVSDETRTLKEGEVFCQVDSLAGQYTVTGKCIVFGNPCLHPGDIRLVEAVNCPELSQCRNVIVFPTTGNRDLPSMMGGGNLDGDHYTLIWDQRLIIPREYEPLDYNASSPSSDPQGEPVDIEATKSFWLDYILNDAFGTICDAHMALADQLENGPCNETCLHLAKLASQAVDFIKTGIPADIPQLRLESYPDFMGKLENVAPLDRDDGKQNERVSVYKSTKVLGEMYRSIDTDPKFEPASLNDTGWGLFGLLPQVSDLHWKEYIQHSFQLKTRYDFELTGLLRTYNICEAECVAGVLLPRQKRRVRMERDYNIRVAMRESYAHIASFFVSEAIDILSGNPITENIDTDKQAWALACYHITYDKSYSRNSIASLASSDTSKTEEESSGEEDDSSESLDMSGSVSEVRYSFAWLFSHFFL